MRALIVAAAVCAFGASAQETKKAEMTADQVIEKSIDAAGGRAALEKLTSTYAKGSMEMGAMGMHGTIEYYSKAPNKLLVVTTIEGMGEMKQGFDGQIAWALTPQGLVDITGPQLDAMKRQATFNRELKWREMFPKVELKGKEKVGDKDAWVVVMSPAAGEPVTQYYDAASFLLIRQNAKHETPQGQLEITTDFSDYRDLGNGMKAPFQLTQKMPMGEMVTKISEMKNNVPIDDAKFTKPAQK